MESLFQTENSASNSHLKFFNPNYLSHHSINNANYKSPWNSTNVINEPSRQIKESKNTVNKPEKEPEIIKTKINDIQMDGYYLKNPIDTIIKFYPNEVLAIIPDLEIYGEGDNEIEAINELKLELVDLFNDLKNIPNTKLGKYPKSWKKIVCSLVEYNENKKI